MITYQRLWETMKKRGITQYHLIKREKFSAGQIGRLKNNQTVSTQTLDTLCRLLSCRIEDIVTYIPDGGEHLPDPEPDQTSRFLLKKSPKVKSRIKVTKRKKAIKRIKRRAKRKIKTKIRNRETDEYVSLPLQIL